MQGSLGEKIGEGAFSEAYAWAPGQVVKLFKAGVSRQFGRHEVRMIRAVLAAGLPVPEVFGDADGTLHWLTRDTGQAQLRLPTDGAAIAAQPVLSGGTVLVVTRKGGLFAFRP